MLTLKRIPQKRWHVLFAMETIAILCSSPLLLLLMALHTHSYCPPGLIKNKSDENSTSCVCMESLNGVINCDETSGVARLAIGYCMSFDFATNSTLVGRCPFNNNYTLTDLGTVAHYVTLPEDVKDLMKFFCGQYNRHQLFCNECSDLHKSSMTSYSQECIPCDKKYRNLGRVAYFFIQIIPVTIIYIVIIAFDIRLTTSPWSVFIFYSQVIVSMLNYDRHLYSGLLYIAGENTLTTILVKIVLAFYGFWNLDFIPNILPPFCLDIPKDGRHELAYQLLVALYPLVLVAFIYFCIHLYSHDVKWVVVLWRTVKYCVNYRLCCGLKYLIQRISSQSIVHSFSSFLVLAYPKILFSSLDLLLPIQVYSLNENKTVMFLSLLYSPTSYQFLSDRLPYVVCAIFIVLIITILPTLLVTVYPLCVAKWCRTPLSVRLFVESFNGWLNDGTQEGTRDFRVLAGLHSMLRIILAISIALNIMFVHPLSPFAYLQWLVPGLVFLLCSLFFVLARPYKLLYMNQCDSALYALLSAISLLVSNHLGLYFASVIGTIPMLFFMGYITHKILKSLKKYFSSCHFRCNQEISLVSEDFDADRLENPTEYLVCPLEDTTPDSTKPPLSTCTYGTF